MHDRAVGSGMTGEAMAVTHFMPSATILPTDCTLYMWQ